MGNELREMSAQNKLPEWAGKITACRNSGQPLKTWCRENGVCEQTYYKWVKRLVTIAQEQREVQFAEVTPILPARCRNVAVTVRLVGAETDNLQRCGCSHRGGGAANFEIMLTDFSGADRVHYLRIY